MEISFAQIGAFISKNLIWFLIPVIVVLVAFFVQLIIRRIAIRSAKKITYIITESRGAGRKYYEGKRQDKLSRTDKKTR